MKCPACFNELTVVPAGSINVDVCQGGCGGIWFDAFELQKADEINEAGDVLLEIQRDEHLVVDKTRKRSCPRCPDIKLRRHLFNPKSSVQVDHCPNCGGYWLDAGELAQIRSEQAMLERHEKARDSSISAEFIRYIYRLEASTRGRQV